MKPWRQIWHLTRRDFLERGKSRGFQVTLLLTVVIFVAMIPIFALAFKEPAPVRIGITEAVPDGTEAVLRQLALAADITVEVEPFGEMEEAEAALEDGAVEVVYTGTEVVWFEEESAAVAAVIRGAATASKVRETAAALRLTEAELQELLAPPALGVSTLLPPDPEEEPRRIAAMVGLLVLYMSIIIFGQFVGTGVMEEKQNRVVEVVMSRVEPVQVLVGKVVGIGVLGLIQLVVLGGSAWLALNFVDLPGVPLPAIGAEILVGVVLWFLLGYTMYAVLFAAMGATVSRQEDMQGAMMIPILFMLPGFFIAQIAQEAPDMTLVVVASLVPLWTPMVMPVRAAVGAVSSAELALAVGLLAVATYLVIRIGARLYRGAVLRIGGKVRLRDAWRGVV